MPEISCGCCGGFHPSVAEVRRCCTEGGGGTDGGGRQGPGDVGGDDDSSGGRGGFDDGGGFGDGGRQDAPAASGDAVPLTELGPRGGRSVVIGPGADAPPNWQGGNCERIVIDDDVVRAPEAVLDELQRRWASRTPSVIELRTELDGAGSEQREGPAYGFEPSMHFPLERLAHLIWANSIDGRDPDAPRLHGLPGWTPTPTDDLPPAGTPPRADRTPLLVDGGPLSSHLPEDPSLALLPRISVERGHLGALRPCASAAALADDQLAAVAHEGGAARIIAPAGSGKTRVLTERARLLVNGWGVPVSSLSLVAFNVRAASEMRDRLDDVSGLDIRTLNSLGLAVLSGTGRFAAPSGATTSQRRLEVIDEPTVRSIIGRLVDLPRKANTDPAAAWIEALAQVRLGLRAPADVEAESEGDLDGFVEFFERYRAVLVDRGAVDFDEQIYRAVELLAADPAVRSAAQRACRVLLVDEFQDLTPAHLTLLRLVAAPRYDTFGVGDDDQTIYGYTGADPGWLIDYPRYFPGATSHALHTNYRCPPEVVNAASCLLTHNRRRLDKQIHPAPGRTGNAADLSVVTGDDPEATTVTRIAELLDGGVHAGDIAVLCRVNSVLAPVQVGLTEAGIPCTTPVDLRFLERTGVRSALAWLEIAGGRWSSPAILREAARRPSRGIAPRVVDWMCEQHDLDGIARLAGRLRDRDAAKVEQWYGDALELARKAQRGATTAELLEHIRSRVGLARATDTLDRARRTVDRSSHHDDLDALVALARMQPEPAGFAPWLADRLRPDPGATDGRRSRGDYDASVGRVVLSTIHRVKGQEWPHVLVGNVNEDLLPHRLSSDLEEERRLLHVAITRASVSCTVVASAARPSPMLSQLHTRWEPRSAGVERDRAPGADRGSRRRTEPSVAATVGMELEHGGYRLTVIELNDGGVVASTGRSRTTLAFGTEVRIDGAVRSLRAPAPGAGGSSRATGKPAPPVTPDSDDAREALKAWRLERCRLDKVPAYVVFTDATLEDVLARRPTTLEELLGCRGIGPAKVERYGDEILAVLDEHRT